jgi:uncharacterized protein
VDSIIALIFSGFFVGAFGTLIGAGGGFILVPILLYMFPAESPEVLTSISLAVVFLNSASGTVAYARKKCVDFRAGLIFALASMPGAIIGALSVAKVSRQTFEPVFGVLMIAGGLFVFFKPNRNPTNGPQQKSDRRKTVYDLRFGIVISIFVGFISSFLGIGGGIIHVPTLIHLLDFPVQIATATSQFVLMIMAFVGTVVHLFEGTLLPHLEKVFYIGLPAVLGAQLGAILSQRVKEAWITRALAVALVLVGLRLIFF